MKIISGIKWFIEDYFSRHKNIVDLMLHLIGIPQALYGLFLIFTGRWQPGILNFFLGYLWQWIGHKYFEKNEAGEITLIKNILKKFAKKG